MTCSRSELSKSIQKRCSSKGDPSFVSAGRNDAGTKAFVFAVSFDDKDRRLWSVDAASGERALLDHLHDDAWHLALEAVRLDVDPIDLAGRGGEDPGAGPTLLVTETSFVR